MEDSDSIGGLRAEVGEKMYLEHGSALLKRLSDAFVKTGGVQWTKAEL